MLQNETEFVRALTVYFTAKLTIAAFGLIVFMAGVATGLWIASPPV